METARKLYIMISKTDTGVGSLIRMISEYPYNHVSITMDHTFRTWYSFARFNKSTPLWGGFLAEPVERFLAKGQQIDIRVFALPLPSAQVQRLEQLFSTASSPNCPLVYNHLELLTLALGIKLPIADAYTCLGFASRVLDKPYPTIRDLDQDLSAYLYYEGTLNALAPDHGDRSDAYFRDLTLMEVMRVTALHMGCLFHRFLRGSKQDTVASYLFEKNLL